MILTEQHGERSAAGGRDFRHAGSGGDVEAFTRLIGRSASFEHLINQMHSASPHLRVATIEGEPGTGKRLVAQQLQQHGPFRAGSLVAARASDLNEHIRSADCARSWCELCDRARHGMLLLEGIDLLSPVAQETVLDYLHSEDASRSTYNHTTSNFAGYYSAGLERGHPDTVRVPAMQLVATSSGSLRSLVGAGKFSRELAFRLTAMRFVLPPLRERREDVSVLADHFIAMYAAKYSKVIRGLDPIALTRLLNHEWPGNVRELESVIEAACLEVAVQWIRPIDLRLTPCVPSLPGVAEVGVSSTNSSAPKAMDDLTLDTVIQRHIADILTRTHGNKLRTARLLGISRSTLYRMLQGGQTM